MSTKNDANAMPENQDQNDNNEAPRAKTPLERVREGQAKMRGKNASSGPGGGAGEATSSASSFKRPLYQRKAG